MERIDGKKTIFNFLLSKKLFWLSSILMIVLFLCELIILILAIEENTKTIVRKVLLFFLAPSIFIYFYDKKLKQTIDNNNLFSWFWNIENFKTFTYETNEFLFEVIRSFNSKVFVFKNKIDNEKIQNKIRENEISILTINVSIMNEYSNKLETNLFYKSQEIILKILNKLIKKYDGLLNSSTLKNDYYSICLYRENSKEAIINDNFLLFEMIEKFELERKNYSISIDVGYSSGNLSGINSLALSTLLFTKKQEQSIKLLLIKKIWTQVLLVKMMRII